MTRIIMSDTESLRENSVQNTFLVLMFAVAYSIGPVCTPREMVRLMNRCLVVFSLPFLGDGVLP